jgi:hypothetical protein
MDAEAVSTDLPDLPDMSAQQRQFMKSKAIDFLQVHRYCCENAVEMIHRVLKTSDVRDEASLMRWMAEAKRLLKSFEDGALLLIRDNEKKRISLEESEQRLGDWRSLKGDDYRNAIYGQ